LDVTIHSLWPINRHPFTMITEFVKKYIAVPRKRHVLLSACFSETRPTVLLICAYE
jgi:hypothetical protein